MRSKWPVRMAALLAVLGTITVPNQALAAPGQAQEVYSANVYKGEYEAEARFGQIIGGPDAGEQALTLEFGFTPTDRLRIEALAEFGRDVGGPRKVRDVGIEAIYHIGRFAGIDVAAYGEFDFGIRQPDALETKLLLERKTSAFDARLNLVAEKPLAAGVPVELSYAASVDVPVTRHLRFGAAAFGELGTFRDFAPDAEHYAGPVIKGTIEHIGGHTLKLEGGYLFALGEARQNASGQARFLAELEF
ncbi:hypothetical protein [Novosphingobium sp.]|uniref:hypothetical protein n=1 Tax=Novosphingobium sp. TaxID=1874826 RepID=UPI0025CF7C19|nr:hypothetical protein [Novosphingobium sp.]